MFEPTHGSAPDIYGRNIANPIATIHAGAMMADFLGQKQVAEKIREAILTHLAEGRIATPDRGGTSSTQAVGDDIAKRASK